MAEDQQSNLEDELIRELGELGGIESDSSPEKPGDQIIKLIRNQGEEPEKFFGLKT